MSSSRRLYVSSGIEGLDDVLGGGVPPNRMYVVQGTPGAGKTTLAMQFLLEGVARGEPCLYVTLAETRSEILAVAASHGWSMDGISIVDLTPDGTGPNDEEVTLYVPSDVELGERMAEILAQIDRVGPRRIVIDSCSELRLLAQSALRFRRQLLSLKNELERRGCTILLLENPSGLQEDVLLQSFVHGVIELEQLSPLYGAERRRLRVVKMREVKYRGGYHDFVIVTGGLRVFPRLVAAEHHAAFEHDLLPTGVGTLDALLGGGIHRGTSSLILGPAGSGKSALATLLACSSAERGERVVMYLFDEGLGTLHARAEGLGMSFRRQVAEGRIAVQQVDPAELSPGEFTARVRAAVDDGARLVVLDSLNGYLNAMAEESLVVLQLHELLSYLRQKGVATILVMAQHGLMGPGMRLQVDVSYLADTVVLLRYFEAQGRVRKAISVVKKRSGPHEDTIREIRMGPDGISVGPPLDCFRGVLTGVPQFDGDAASGRRD